MPMNCNKCNNFNFKEECCWLARDMFLYDEDYCPFCEEEDPLADDEKREIVGDRKAHEIMETEGRVE